MAVPLDRQHFCSRFRSLLTIKLITAFAAQKFLIENHLSVVIFEKACKIELNIWMMLIEEPLIVS